MRSDCQIGCYLVPTEDKVVRNETPTCISSVRERGTLFGANGPFDRAKKYCVAQSMWKFDSCSSSMNHFRIERMI